MSTPDHATLDQLLATALQSAPVLGSVVQAMDGCWLIECPSGSALWVEYTATNSTLALTTSLGPPDPVHETAALNLALASNQRWHGHSALRIARDSSGGDLLLLDQLDADKLTAQALTQGLLHFEAARALWSLALRGLGQRRGQPGAPPSHLLDQRA